MTEQELIDKINDQVDANISDFNDLLDLAQEIKASITTDYVPLYKKSDHEIYTIGLHQLTQSTGSRYYDIYVYDSNNNLVRSMFQCPTSMFFASSTGAKMYVPILINGSVVNLIEFNSTNRGKLNILVDGYKVRVIEYGI